ncbi:uncharacterized protein MELLADRAFT_73007 [Melampsora larici-populina 98AG31]|uniref:Uncharacterized protein n=1 Tax=Melampsora larici-populina (strain 98AG31 / pathotype 3-4-7) TaxID=747676 RepID=F4S1X6_MELLP|nr:uncharacterized protein MELLADRAFT_73007 [Melampsora larici-populina 98AG31]EGG01364.1 hypothetical protein MELLADRAFT_73007 [Melampsora larici-populina 98AG31]
MFFSHHSYQSHVYHHQTGTYDYLGSNVNQERNYAPKVDLQSSPTNHNLAPKSSEFMNGRNVQRNHQLLQSRETHG